MKIFVSYANMDESRVRELVDILRDAGHDLWFEQQLEAIQSCDCFLYVLTPESVESRWCQWAFAQAVHAGKSIIPVLVQPNTPLSGILNRIPHIDFSHGSGAAAKLLDAVMVGQVIAPDSVTNILPPPFDWVEIPAGRVMLETCDYDRHFSYLKHDTAFEVPAFAIARYPVTNAQYAKFVEAGGYHQEKWWTAAGWEARNQGVTWQGRGRGWEPTGIPWTEPANWPGEAEHPVVGISWYEAVAFCQWLSAVSGEMVILPTEQQWQRAAQGDDGRVYPWGNRKPDRELCNFGENVDQITPVTQYPKGASPYGVMDMSGNVPDYTRTAYRTGDTALDGDAHRCIRGGAFGDNPISLRVAARVDHNPWDRDSALLGFRVALTQ